MKVGVLGCGAFGLALSHIIVSNKISVTCWTHNEKELNNLIKTRINPKLEGYVIENKIKLTNNFEETVKGKDLIIIAVPAFAVDKISLQLKSILTKDQHVLIATKGIENDTCLFLNDVFLKYNKGHKNYAVISGPSFAVDIVKDTPIAFSLATKSKLTDKVVRRCFENDYTKFRSTTDIIGIEICGSIKNVMAIASGILYGMNAPDSTRALFLTETLNDIKNLIKGLGGKKKNILSYAGFGDILMTCTSKNSRNFTLGYLIGKEESDTKINDYIEKTTIEGLYTLISIKKLIRNKNIEIPIINLIEDIVINKKDKNELLKFLIEKK